MRRVTRAVALACVPALIAGIAACSTGDSGVKQGSGGAEDMIERLTLGDFGGGANPQRNFNPYSPSALTSGMIFEPLFVINGYDCKVVPWLGTKYEWEGPTSLVVRTRSGVKWSDGKPFTAKDVAFTFANMKKWPATDTNGLWQVLSDVKAEGTDTVRFTFEEASVPTFQKIAETPIIPEHQWGKVGDPTKFTNENPVATGPFKVKAMNRQQLTLERNPTYWQADKVKVKELRYLKNEGGGQVEQLRLARGEFDWNAMFVPDVEKTFVAKDREHNHYWFPPGASISIYMNLKKAPFDDVNFRKAVALAIDREEIAKKAQYGYVLTASQTGLVLPGQKDWLAPGVENEGKIPYDPEQAKRILADAGYRTQGGKLLGKDGKPMTFSFKTPNGWLDWTAAAQIIQQNLQAIGITIDLQTPTPEKVEAERKNGSFEMTFGVHGGGCNIYDAYKFPLDSRQSAPIGKDAATNFVRWEDPKTDQLLDQLRKEEDVEKQRAIVHQLQQIMLEQFPTVPLWYGATWFEYRTENAVGWPSEENPYAYPDDPLLIITRLRPNTGE